MLELDIEVDLGVAHGALPRDLALGRLRRVRAGDGQHVRDALHLREHGLDVGAHPWRLEASGRVEDDLAPGAGYGPEPLR